MTGAVKQPRATVPGAAVRRRIGVGVIGFGWLGRAHARSYARLPMLFGARAYEIGRASCRERV